MASTVALHSVDESVLERWIIATYGAGHVPGEVIQEYLQWYEITRTRMRRTDSQALFGSGTTMRLLLDLEHCFEGDKWRANGISFALRQRYMSAAVIRRAWELPLRRQFAVAQAFAVSFQPPRASQ